MEYLLLIVGLLLILGGANFLTDGASALAKRFGISDLVVGLTVVAFGTSAPELTISVISAVQGNTGIAIGNVVGSNILNILLIIGAVALARPIKVEKGIMSNEIPLVILSSLALAAMRCAPWLDNAEAEISRVDGILLLLFFAIFMRYVFSQAKAAIPDSVSDNVALTVDAGEKGSKGKGCMPLWRSVVFVVGGLAALIYGGDLFVDNASAIASTLGVSDAIIGLTIVALGTSLPELATSLTAAIKGNSSMAIGNVIGSNIFNAFMVLGAAATVRPLQFGGIGMVDMAVLVGSSLLFWLFGWLFGHRTITRGEGVFMLLCYAGYMAYLIMASV